MSKVKRKSTANRESAATAKSAASRISVAERQTAESPRSKRKQIVQAATRVFFQHGYEGTSISRVAETAGVIKATIYSHFADKRALFKAIVESVTIEQGFDQVEEMARSMPPDALLDMIALKIASHRHDKQFRALIRLVIGESGRFPELAELFYETVSLRGIRMLASCLDEHPELKIADSHAAAHILIGSLVYWVITQEILGGKKVNPFEIERITATLKQILANMATKGSSRRS